MRTMADEPESKRPRLGGEDGCQSVDANQCITFHLMRSDAAFDDTDAFGPEMCHQLFGDDEEIRGYSNPRLDIYFSPQTFEARAIFSFEAKQPAADDVVALLETNFPAGLAFADTPSQFRQTSPAKLPDVRSGDLLGSRKLEDGSTLSVHSFQLCKAAASLKVSLDIGPSKSFSCQDPWLLWFECMRLAIAGSASETAAFAAVLC